MVKLTLTPEEAQLVRNYSALPTGIMVRLPSWLLQLGLPLACALYGVTQNSRVFLGAAIGGLFGLIVVRLYYQQRHAHLFRQVCLKIQAHQTEDHGDA
ncbi:MAG TPA: hypothetical protein VK505_10860 [Steroidobacteraceae bacterium]|nr:hypothetical protein [Steroidobacteraceae bacterium]